MKAKGKSMQEGNLFDEFTWPVQSPRAERSMSIASVNRDRKESIKNVEMNF